MAKKTAVESVMESPTAPAAVKPAPRPITLEQVAVEARHELARLQPTWQCSVCVWRGATYTLGTAITDDPRFQPINVAVPGSGPMTDAVLDGVREQVRKEVIEREKSERRLRL